MKEFSEVKICKGTLEAKPCTKELFKHSRQRNLCLTVRYWIPSVACLKGKWRLFGNFLKKFNLQIELTEDSNATSGLDFIPHIISILCLKYSRSMCSEHGCVVLVMQAIGFHSSVTITSVTVSLLWFRNNGSSCRLFSLADQNSARYTS